MTPSCHLAARVPRCKLWCIIRPLNGRDRWEGSVPSLPMGRDRRLERLLAPICRVPSRRCLPDLHETVRAEESDVPHATTGDGVRLYFEETGSGHPLILVHEFAGDLRSFEPQIRHFGKRYRAIAFNARGFPTSDVPEHVSAYSQARAADDILSVLDHIGEP